LEPADPTSLSNGACSSGGGSAGSGGGSDELDVANGASGQMLVGMVVEPIDERG